MDGLLFQEPIPSPSRSIGISVLARRREETMSRNNRAQSLEPKRPSYYFPVSSSPFVNLTRFEPRVKRNCNWSFAVFPIWKIQARLE